MRAGGKTFDSSENTSLLPATKDRTYLWAPQQQVTGAKQPVGAV